MTEEELLNLIEGLSAGDLQRFVAAGLVRPNANAPTAQRFFAVDVARVRLIRELESDLMLDAEALPVVLQLIDQIHGLHRQMQCLAEALEVLPSDMRERLAQALRDRLGAQRPVREL